MPWSLESQVSAKRELYTLDWKAEVGGQKIHPKRLVLTIHHLINSKCLKSVTSSGQDYAVYSKQRQVTPDPVHLQKV